LLVGALAGAAVLVGCADGLALDRLAAGEHGKVAEVRSGDVMVLDGGLMVRLAGLEVPRTGEAGPRRLGRRLGRRRDAERR